MLGDREVRDRQNLTNTCSAKLNKKHSKEKPKNKAADRSNGLALMKRMHRLRAFWLLLLVFL
jgi:hypothetical protein